MYMDYAMDHNSTEWQVVCCCRYTSFFAICWRLYGF